jgi:hypothetical protein
MTRQPARDFGLRLIRKPSPVTRMIVCRVPRSPPVRYRPPAKQDGAASCRIRRLREDDEIELDRGAPGTHPSMSGDRFHTLPTRNDGNERAQTSSHEQVKGRRCRPAARTGTDHH